MKIDCHILRTDTVLYRYERMNVLQDFHDAKMLYRKPIENK